MDSEIISSGSNISREFNFKHLSRYLHLAAKKVEACDLIIALIIENGFVVGEALGSVQTIMNIAIRIAAQAPSLLCAPPIPAFSFRGVRKLGFVPQLKQSGGLNRKLPINMASSVENSEVRVVESKMGVVRPAEDAFVAEAVEALKTGKVVAVPTDTLYGFACDACSLEAVNRIYEIKGRKHTSPLAICVGDVSDIERFAVTDYLPHGLLDSLLPGPVTVVLKRGESSALERSLNPGLYSIGVRVPDSNFIRNIARGSGTALALTSANLSGQSSSVCVKDFKDLWRHCAYVYDGGLLPSGRAGSTIVDLTTPSKYKILRPGSAKEETVAILEKHSLVEEVNEQ